MLATLISLLLNILAIVGYWEDADAKAPEAASAGVEHLDLVAFNSPADGTQGCRLTGEVTLWVSRQVNVLDGTNHAVGSVEAGLAQFSPQAKLQGCMPGGAPLDLSGRLVNFLVTDARASFGRREAGALATRLTRDSYRLAHREGAPILLVNDFVSNAFGAVSYRFTIVLIRDGDSGSYDAVIHRDRAWNDFSTLGHALHRDLGASTLTSIQ
jgi:hypothetical protein